MRVKLDGGRSISLSQLVQWRTNEGLLCGKPSSTSNDETLQRTLDEARRIGAGLGEPLLIPPTRTPARNGESLPGVTCIAIFNSTALERSDSEPYSSMAVVWLQEAFALPIEERALEEIRRINWEALATDWCW